MSSPIPIPSTVVPPRSIDDVVAARAATEPRVIPSASTTMIRCDTLRDESRSAA